MMDKRFGATPEMPEGWVDIIDTDNNQTLCNVRVEYANNMIELLNKLHEENQQIKDLIHTMLNQINAENITSDNVIYSARINFSKNEFNLIRELWKRSYEE